MAAAMFAAGCGASSSPAGTGSSSGSSGTGSSSPPTATADFTVSASPATVSLTSGGGPQVVSVSATAIGGFSQAIQVSETGLPAGVSAAPANFTVSPGGSQQVTLSAAASAAVASGTLQFTATAGTASHTASVAVSVSAAPIPAGVDFVTYHNDVARTGLNASESSLTPTNVTSAKFGLLRVLPVDGRVDGQPLYLSNLGVAGQLQNVTFAVTEHGSVYGFNADTGAQLWKASMLGANETTSGDHACGQITPEIGVSATPVIDRNWGQHGTMFLVAMSQDGSGAYHQRLHALDVTTGTELPGSPVEVSASFPGTGPNSSGGKLTFNPGQYAERAGLLLVNGTIYLGWTSHCDLGQYNGWLMAYSESGLAQTGVLNLTPGGTEGSIWMSGAGLAADQSGSIYFLDANGTFDSTLTSSGFPVNGDFGNGFLKISGSGGTLAVTDYFEAHNGPALSAIDLDLGSGGALVLPDLKDASGNVRHLAVGAGKDQTIYVVDRDSMGKFNPQNDTALYQEITGAVSAVFSMPAYFNGTVYYGSANDTLKAFPVTNAKLATSAGVHSSNPFPYPGTTPSVSANGTANGIVWAVENSSPAVLHAYDAATLQELYNSNQAASGRDHFGNGNKFIAPVIVNGRVLVGTPSGVAEFGLLP